MGHDQPPLKLSRDAAPDYHSSPEWKAAEAEGIDMSLIELNLSRTPWERIQAHDRALAFKQSLRQGQPRTSAP